MYPRTYPGSNIRLNWLYMNGAGSPAEPVSGSAVVAIYDSGNTQLASGSAMSVSGSLGRYYYDYGVGTGAPSGTYRVNWQGVVNGIAVSNDDHFEIAPAVAAESLGAQLEMAATLRLRISQELVNTQYVSYNTFNDAQLIGFLTTSLQRFNAEPPWMTDITFVQLPRQLYPLVELGAVIDAMISLEVLEAGKHFSYSDNGISITRDRHAKYQSTVGSLLQSYTDTLKRWKQIYAMSSLHPSGQFSSITGYPRSLDRALRGTRKFGH